PTGSAATSPRAAMPLSTVRWRKRRLLSPGPGSVGGSCAYSLRSVLVPTAPSSGTVYNEGEVFSGERSETLSLRLRCRCLSRGCVDDAATEADIALIQHG